MKKWKLVLIASLLVAFMSGLYISANCSAHATGCDAAICRVTAPAGGTTQCTSGARKAECKAFDSSGALCKYIRCICSTPPAFPCIALVPTC